MKQKRFESPQLKQAYRKLCNNVRKVARQEKNKTSVSKHVQEKTEAEQSSRSRTKAIRKWQTRQGVISDVTGKISDVTGKTSADEGGCIASSLQWESIRLLDYRRRSNLFQPLYTNTRQVYLSRVHSAEIDLPRVCVQGLEQITPPPIIKKTDRFSLKRWSRRWRNLKKYNSPGNNNIPEIIPDEANRLAKRIHDLCQAAQMTEEMPDEWIKSVTVTIPRKGHLSEYVVTTGVCCRKYNGERPKSVQLLLRGFSESIWHLGCFKVIWWKQS